MIGEITNIGVYLSQFGNSIGAIAFHELNKLTIS